MRISMEPDMALPSPLSRVALAMSDVVADPQIDDEISLVSSTFTKDELSFRPDNLPVHVRRIYDAAQRAWGELVNHPFPGQMARGIASLNGFRHYMIQDAIYLEYYARVRMQSIARSGSKASFKEIVEFSEKLSKTLGYSTAIRNTCTQQLGVPANAVANEPMTPQLRASIQLYEDVVKNRRGDWLAIHIVLLPCIMGYYAIASKLLEEPKIVTNTLYYPLWIQFNAGASTFKKYINLINDRIEKHPPAQRHWDYWIQIFASACGTEKNFFDLALQNRTYEIVPDGYYTIYSYADRRFLASVGEQVVMQSDPTNAGWILRSSGSGYSIVNITTNMSLVAVMTQNFPSYCEVRGARTVETQWSINPIPTSDGDGYQLLWSPQLQYALTVDVSGRESKVIAANNYKGTDQVWVLLPPCTETKEVEVGSSAETRP